MKRIGASIFTLESICNCVSSIGIGDKYFTAWVIIGLMLERKIDDVNSDCFDRELLDCTMKRIQTEIENLVQYIKIPIIKKTEFEEENEASRKRRVDLEVLRIRKFVKLQLERNHKLWLTLLNMAELVRTIRNSLKDILIKFNLRTKICLYLLPENFFELTNSFDYKKHLLDNIPIIDPTHMN
jgi:hypothetical protein